MPKAKESPWGKSSPYAYIVLVPDFCLASVPDYKRDGDTYPACRTFEEAVELKRRIMEEFVRDHLCHPDLEEMLDEAQDLLRDDSGKVVPLPKCPEDPYGTYGGEYSCRCCDMKGGCSWRDWVRSAHYKANCAWVEQLIQKDLEGAFSAAAEIATDHDCEPHPPIRIAKLCPADPSARKERYY